MYKEEFINSLQQYSSKLDIDILTKACLFADKAHLNQFRRSSEPYITHPLRIAFDLIEYSFDTSTIAAAILHDVLEDTKVTEIELKEHFGEEIVSLVVGVTKLSKYDFSTIEEAKTENLRKFILSFIDDIRVLIIKIFDRVHNIRTLHYIDKEEKRKRIARETLDIYAPLAQRLSLNLIKDELEDTCFSILDPEIRNTILQKSKEFEKFSTSYINKVKNNIFFQIQGSHIEDFTVTSRLKTPYSIWKKMQRKSLSFEDITDIIGIRIIIPKIEECYEILGIIHRTYKTIFSRFRDYISYPKPNNYQSIHTCIIVDEFKKIEIQIRTKEMDYFAGRGVACHWNYKNPTKTKYDISQYSWLKNLLTIIQTKELPADYIYEYSKMQMFTDEVFIITPNNDIISMEKGSTILDFAYTIHSEIGHQCVSGVVNGFNKPLFTELKNGDRINIIKDEQQTPKIYWLSFVKTPIAKMAIKKYINQKYKKEIFDQACLLLDYGFQKYGLNFHIELLPKILEKLSIKSEQKLLDQLLEGHIDVPTIVNTLYPKINTKEDLIYKNVVTCAEINEDSVSMGNCCFPVYGDPILGVILPSNKVEIHHKLCNKLYYNLEHLNKITAKWNNIQNIKQDYFYKVKIKIVLTNVIGSLFDIVGLMYKNSISILEVLSENSYILENYQTIRLVLAVKSNKDVSFIIKELKKSSHVKEATRLLGNYYSD